jgi:hypothetical protein
VGSRTGLDAVVKRTFDHPAHSPALYHGAIPTPIDVSDDILYLEPRVFYSDLFCIASFSGKYVIQLTNRTIIGL